MYPYRNTTLLGYLQKKRHYLILLAVLVLLTPLLWRSSLNNVTVPGKESYYYLIESQTEGKNALLAHPFLWLLSFSDSIGYYLLLPVALGLLSIWCLTQLRRTLGLDEQEQLVFLIFLILSPAFISSFTTLNPTALLLTLLLTGFYLITRKEPLVRWGALFPFSLLVLFDVFSSLVLLLVLIPYTAIKKDKAGNILTGAVIVLALIAVVVLHKPFFASPFFMEDRLTEFFSDLGGMRGMNLFILVLAVGGLIRTWKKPASYPLYLILLFLLSIYLLTGRGLLLLTVVTTLLAALAAVYLVNRPWKLAAIKNFTLFVLILGILFSSLSVGERLALAAPTPLMVRSLTILNEESTSGEVILSSLDNSNLIRYYAQRTPFLDYRTLNLKERLLMAQTIFTSSYLPTSKPLLEEQQITFIYITPDMKEQGLVVEEQGLLFLTKNERFKRVHQNEGIEIWRFE